MSKAKARAKAREAMKRIRLRVGKAGWVSRGFWVRTEWLESMRVTAARLGTSQRAIACAVFEVGLRRLTTSDVVAADKHFREMSSLPICKLLKLKQLVIRRDPQTGRIVGYSPKEGAA